MRLRIKYVFMLYFLADIGFRKYFRYALPNIIMQQFHYSFLPEVIKIRNLPTFQFTLRIMIQTIHLSRTYFLTTCGRYKKFCNRFLKTILFWSFSLSSLY